MDPHIKYWNICIADSRLTIVASQEDDCDKSHTYHSSNINKDMTTMVMKAVAILSMLASSEAFAPNLSLSRKSIAANVITSQWSMDDPAPEVSCQLSVVLDWTGL